MDTRKPLENPNTEERLLPSSRRSELTSSAPQMKARIRSENEKSSLTLVTIKVYAG